MRNDRQKAQELRKQGGSYRAIEQQLGVSRSTLSNWFHAAPWSKVIKKKLLKITRDNASGRMRTITDQIREKRRKLYFEKREEARLQFNDYQNDELFISGLMIYWGEGDSKLENGMIRVANTDPMMLKFFHLFLKKYLSEIAQDSKAYLILYKDHDDEKNKLFWSSKIGIPFEKFIGSHFIKGKHPTKRLEHGICTIRVCNRAYKEKISMWLTLMKGKISNMRV